MIDDSDLTSLLQMRKSHWAQHPIVSAGAVLPTRPLGWITSIVIMCGRRQRSAVAFWAHPLSGKSSCIEVLVRVLPTHFPGCGIFVHEATSSLVLAEGTFTADLLHSMDYEPKIRHELAEKRNQLRRALYALGADGEHIFILIDEAQELAEMELCWLKGAINWLIGRKLKVTVVLFGQHELMWLRNGLASDGRSDLNARFTATLRELESPTKIIDVLPALEACDQGSEWPEGSGWSYTHFLWPRAFEGGMRLTNHAKAMWRAFEHAGMNTKGRASGVGMNYFADALASLADLTRDSDSSDFQFTKEHWAQAVINCGYAERPLLVKTKNREHAPRRRGR